VQREVRRRRPEAAPLPLRLAPLQPQAQGIDRPLRRGSDASCCVRSLTFHACQVAGVPGVTEALFSALQAALGEGGELTGAPILYGCALCGKEYRNSRAHAQHLSSRSHLMRASDEGPDSSIAGVTVVKLKPPAERRGPAAVEGKEERIEELADESTSDTRVDEDFSTKCGEEPEELDPLLCFMCDLKHDTVEDCMVHMHRKHGFFVPDSEYLKDPHGLLTYVGLKVHILFCFV
jgi:pre-60S factor REI1